MWQISSRTRNGTWLEVRSTSRPSSSSQPRVAWVSRAAWRDALRLPGALDDGVGRGERRRRRRRVSPCICGHGVALGARDARLGALVAVQQRRAGRARDARGRRRRAAPRTRRRSRASARSRDAARVSATTAATRWPRNRSTGSSTSVSSGSSVAVLVAAGREQRRGGVAVGEHGVHAGQRLGRGRVDRRDAGVRRAGCPARRGAAASSCCGGRACTARGRSRRASPAGAVDRAAGRIAVGARPRCCVTPQIASRIAAVAGAAAQVALEEARAGRPRSAVGRTSRRSRPCRPCRSRTGTRPRRRTPAARGAGARGCRDRRPS